MSEHALPVLYTLFLWWFSTGLIVYLDGLHPRTFRWSLAGAGALAVLAYVAWIRGAGAVADDRLNLAERCAPHHPHVRAVRRMTRATPVAVVATDPAWAWGKHTRATEGR